MSMLSNLTWCGFKPTNYSVVLIIIMICQHFSGKKWMYLNITHKEYVSISIAVHLYSGYYSVFVLGRWNENVKGILHDCKRWSVVAVGPCALQITSFSYYHMNTHLDHNGPESWWNCLSEHWDWCYTFSTSIRASQVQWCCSQLK